MVLVHRLRDNKIHFHQATKDRRISLIPGIHYFDAHRLQLLLLQAPTLQIHLRASPLAGPEGAGETVEDPSSDEERATTDGESEVEVEAEEADLPPEEPWCPPIPDAKPQWRATAVSCMAIQVLPIDGTRKETTCRESMVPTVGGQCRCNLLRESQLRLLRNHQPIFSESALHSMSRP